MLIILLSIILILFFSYLIYSFSFIEKEFEEINQINGLQKVTTKNTYGYLNFITDDENKILLDFIDSNKEMFHIRSKDTELFMTMEKIPDYPKVLLEKIRKRIMIKEGYEKYYPDLNYESAISYIKNGGSHDYHRDMNYLDWILVRYNLTLSKPIKGGESVYGDEINSWGEKSVWKCVAGIVKHGVTKVEGNKPRIVLCLGFMIELKEILKKAKPYEVKNFQSLPEEISYLQNID